jgi:hypothetical protein
LACAPPVRDNRPQVTLLRLTAPAFLAFSLASALIAQKPSAADLGHAILTAGLDPTACYRVRDLEISQEDAHFYLTDGYIIFGKPVNGAPIAAVFSAEVEGGDAEVLMFPPNRSERKSLAGYTGSPNLDEHFTNAVFLFTETQARGLAEQIRAKGEPKNSPDVGAVLADRWSPVVANLAVSFESRMVLDLLTGVSESGGFFVSIVQGRKLGNFDLGYDGRSYEQLSAGQLNTRNGRSYFDTWTSFAGKSHRNAPEPEEEILSYRIEATLDSSFILHCVTRIRIRATAESRNVLPFDLSAQMRATEATVDGVAAEVYERDSIRNNLVQGSGNELMLVVPPQPLEPGSEHEVEIRHEGKVVLEAGHQVYFVSSRGSWYPNRGAQFAAYDVTYRYPANLDLVSAGRLTEDRTEGDVRIAHWEPDGRIRMLAFNLGVYERKVLERDGVRIEVAANREVEDALRYRPPEPRPIDPVAAAANSGRRPRGFADANSSAEPLQVLPPVANPVDQLSHVAGDIVAAVDFYRARFGEPPVNRIEVSPVPGRFGQGFAGMIYLSTLSYLPVTARPLSLMPPWEQVFFGELLRAHEVAHQWWGNIVTTGAYRDEWLMEALSNYSALLFLESRPENAKASKLIDTMLDQYRRQLLTKGPDGETAESEGPVVQGRRLENSNNPTAWIAVAYGKGAWIIHMLRRRLGDAQFTKMLAELRRRYEWKTIDTEQFRLLCAEFLPPRSPDPKLESFFDQWVYGTGIPTLKLNYSVKGGKLTGTVKQSDVPDDFSVTVPVEIQTGRGKVVLQLRTGDEPVPFSVPVVAANAKAVLDPSSSVLRR